MSCDNVNNNLQVNKKLLWSEELCQFIEALDAYAPTIPEAVIKYNMQKGTYFTWDIFVNIYFTFPHLQMIEGGCSIYDPRVVKLVSLASDKFITEIINEAKEFNAIRKTKSTKRKSVSSASTLEMVRNIL